MYLDPFWLDSFFTVNFVNESDRQPIPDADFRKNGILFFYKIMALCDFSREAIEKSIALFRIEQYIQANALTRKFIIVPVVSIFSTFITFPYRRIVT